MLSFGTLHYIALVLLPLVWLHGNYFTCLQVSLTYTYVLYIVRSYQIPIGFFQALDASKNIAQRNVCLNSTMCLYN